MCLSPLLFTNLCLMTVLSSPRWKHASSLSTPPPRWCGLLYDRPSSALGDRQTSSPMIAWGQWWRSQQWKLSTSSLVLSLSLMMALLHLHGWVPGRWGKSSIAILASWGRRLGGGFIFYLYALCETNTTKLRQCGRYLPNHTYPCSGWNIGGLLWKNWWNLLHRESMLAEQFCQMLPLQPRSISVLPFSKH